MTLSDADVQKALETAIVTAKLGNAEAAPQFAAALTPLVTDALNDILDGTPFDNVKADLNTSAMHVVRSLLVRDAVSEVLDKVGTMPSVQVAEHLLKAGLIDVEKVAGIVKKVEEPKAVTGTHSTATVVPTPGS